MKKMNENEKKPYEAPQLRCIDLEARDVMGVGCKTLAGGPNTLQPAGCGISSTCSSEGS